jgi:hypothetical protein
LVGARIHRQGNDRHVGLHSHIRSRGIRHRDAAVEASALGAVRHQLTLVIARREVDDNQGICLAGAAVVCENHGVRGCGENVACRIRLFRPVNCPRRPTEAARIEGDGRPARSIANLPNHVGKPCINHKHRLTIR